MTVIGNKMKIIIRKCLLISCLIVCFMSQTYSQINIDTTNITTIYLSSGIGYKYHVNKIDAVNQEKDVYKNHYSFVVDLAVDFWGKKKHILGLEFIGFPHVYGEHSMSPHYFTLLASVFYRRNIFVLNNISFSPAAQFTIFSNDASHLFTISLDLAVTYTLKNYEVFLKNSFRVSPSMLPNTPWIISIGSTLKI